MAACVRKVYDIDNDKNIVHLGQRPLDVEALGFSLSSLWGSPALPQNQTLCPSGATRLSMDCCFGQQSLKMHS